MSLYWAKFGSINGETFRLDTRIYLNDISRPNNRDVCIGAIVGKNPGSAKPSIMNSSIQEIVLDGDKLLPTVRNIVLKAYRMSGRSVAEKGFIQVLNLFYLCNPNLGAAITAIKNSRGRSACSTEGIYFPWVWYVWGGESTVLTPFKSRFLRINTENHFFFDNKLKQVVKQLPSALDFAKHTQGLRHECVVPHLASIIKNG